MQSGDTIAAISSAVGPAARMIVRASGPDSVNIAAAICTEKPAPSRSIRSVAHLQRFQFPLDILWFPAGHSATGEDTIEFHLIGNVLLASALLEELVRRGARHAEAGEFTARAYFNGRLDLSQAEGVAATIAARNDHQLSAARRLLSGELARKLSPLMESLAATLALVEVGIDFIEEDVSFLSDEALRNRIGAIDDALRGLLSSSRRLEAISADVTIVLVGRPNAGKSTLLNALAGADRAIVSPGAGTTRDVLSAEVQLPGGAVRIIDVAGIEREDDPSDSSSQSAIARQMREHALRAVESADVVLLVHDCTSADSPPALSRPAALLALTKADLESRENTTFDFAAEHILRVSALANQNLDELKRRLDQLAFALSDVGETLVLSARHLEAIESSRRSLAHAVESMGVGHELVAVDLREALDSLGLILGTVSPDELLGKIFSAFCIGK